ncbi:MAG: hypothetical protein GF355_16625 [Candidatus Eisenbacteria bacterium]|nr:hypothetical protein [Candidatus Eisenbacteria bacterium]
MKKIIALSLVMLFAGTVVYAPVPDPANCAVDPWDTSDQVFATPGQQSDADLATITVHDSADLPMPGADVELDFSGCPDRCEAEVGLSGVTNGNGQVTLNPAMGGCDDCTITIRANGYSIRVYNRMTSTDWNGTECDGCVTPGEFAFFGGAFLATFDDCADYNGTREGPGS